MLLSFKECITSPLRYLSLIKLCSGLASKGPHRVTIIRERKCSFCYNSSHYINKCDAICRFEENFVPLFAVYYQMTRLNNILEYKYSGWSSNLL